MKISPALLLSLALLLVPAVSRLEAYEESAALWKEYTGSPDNHSHIPNVSHAGYRSGETPPPRVPVVFNVKDFGAVADGDAPSTSDNSLAFRSAIDAAAARGGGAVFVPEGTYSFENIIRIRHSGVVLRGAGQGKTVLKFRRHLTEIFGAQKLGAASRWNWSGGLVWMAPDTNFSTDAKMNWVFAAKPPEGYGGGAPAQSWEYFHHGAELASVALAPDQEIPRGERIIPVSDAAKLKEGEYYIMTWDNTPDQSLLREIGDHPLLAEAPAAAFGSWLTHCGDHDATPPKLGNYPRWQWPVQIVSVDREKDTVTLAQPLRVSTRPEWKCRFWEMGSHVREAGLEDLTIILPGTPNLKHNAGFGWNGVYVSNALNCWVRDVEVRDGECGIIVTGSKHVSVLNTLVGGSMPMHHPYAARCETQDCLWDGFEIDITGPNPGPLHGINTEWLSAGNVWTRGHMQQGTFDSHSGLSFDYLRTGITLKNDSHSGPGGAKQAGFYSGRRVVHWNVLIEGSDRAEAERGLYIYQPSQFVRSVLCGIQGARITDRPPFHMPDGDKDVRIADDGIVPKTAPNLYDAQLQLHKDREALAQWALPNTGLTAPGDITLKAAVAAKAGRNIVRVEYLANEKVVASADSAPWEAVWNAAPPGAYSIQVRMTDNTGEAKESPGKPLTVGRRLRIEGTDPGWKFEGGDWVSVPGPQYSGGSLLRAPTKGGRASFTFTGTRVRLVTTSIGHGSQKTIVYLDDLSKPMVNLPGLRPTMYDHEYWDSGPLADGVHTVGFERGGEECNIDFIEIDSTNPAVDGAKP